MASFEIFCRDTEARRRPSGIALGLRPRLSSPLRPRARTSEREPMRAVVLASLLLLSACSYFGPKDDWKRSGTNEDVASSDLESCKQQARAMIARDERIDADISAQNIEYDYMQSTGTLESNLNQYQQGNRYDSIVSDCMAAQGYGQAAPEEAPEAQAAP